MSAVHYFTLAGVSLAPKAPPLLTGNTWDYDSVPPAPVEGKVPCLFKVGTLNVPSAKRGGRSQTVVALDVLSDYAEAVVDRCIPTKKIDGTCSKIQDGVLYRRYDRKFSKQGKRKSDKLKKAKERAEMFNEPYDEAAFEWNIETDFKVAPEEWQPCEPEPSSSGHWVGWVPVTPGEPEPQGSDKWHVSAIDAEQNVYTLQVDPTDGLLKEVRIPLATAPNGSYELVGPKVQGNLYNFPEVPSVVPKGPRHWLVRHGSICFANPPQPPYSLDGLREWFQTDPEGAVEGIVWHGPDGELIKVHRGHLSLPWPLEGLRLVDPDFVS